MTVEEHSREIKEMKTIVMALRDEVEGLKLQLATHDLNTELSDPLLFLSNITPNPNEEYTSTSDATPTPDYNSYLTYHAPSPIIISDTTLTSNYNPITINDVATTNTTPSYNPITINDAATTNTTPSYNPITINDASPASAPSSLLTTPPTKEANGSRPGRLSSNAICKENLLPLDYVLQKHTKLIGKESLAGALACKLARDVYFGKEIMVQCTASGYGDKPGLPLKELRALKETMKHQFPQYITSHEFEAPWSKCLLALSQSCKRLRN